jgi:hypothetical protein
MGKRIRTMPKLDKLDYSLGGFDWVDNEPKLWPLFARWLTEKWYSLYRHAFNELPGVVIDLRDHKQTVYKPATPSWGDTFGAMTTAIEQLADQLPKCSSREQLALVQTEARKLGLSTTGERVEKELERFLTFQPHPEYIPLFKASPWCNYFANREHILERAGTNLPYKLYSQHPGLRLALENVISEFGSIEISCAVSPTLSRLFAVQRAFKQLREKLKELPPDSVLSTAYRNAEPGFQSFWETLQSEISKVVNAPDALTPPLRVRRIQRALFYSVHHLCKSKDGSAKLAGFIHKLLKDWPQLPAGMTFNFNDYFDAAKCQRILREHLGLADAQTNKDFRALSHVLRAIVWRDELRDSLLRLACHARAQAEQQRKGWQHLQKALVAVFTHICREPSIEEQIRNFERSNFPEMRNLSRERRMQLLPEMGNDPDHSDRDLTKKERMAIASRLLAEPKTSQSIPPSNPAAFSAQYSRAMKAVRKELGQD